MKKEFTSGMSVQWEYSAPSFWIRDWAKLESELKVACEAFYDRITEFKTDKGFYPKNVSMKIFIKDHPNFTATCRLLTAAQGTITVESIQSTVIGELQKNDIRWDNLAVTKIQLIAKGLKSRSVLRPQDDIQRKGFHQQSLSH